MLDLQHLVGRVPDVRGDRATVRRPNQERPEDEHVERALQQLRAIVAVSHDGRHSTMRSGRGGRHSSIGAAQESDVFPFRCGRWSCGDGGGPTRGPSCARPRDAIARHAPCAARPLNAYH